MENQLGKCFQFYPKKTQKLKFIRQLPVFVFRVGNEFLIAAIYDPVQVFEGNLADDIRQ
jgi:hypothetical protein